MFSLLSSSIQEDDTNEMISKLEGRAAAVLRNLAHNTKQHQLLMQSGAVDALADIMRQNKVGPHEHRGFIEGKP